LHGTTTREIREAALEVKFLVPVGLAEQLIAWARHTLSPDPHGIGQWADEYQTSSLYFDTDQLDVYHRRGSFKRSKYRIRRYGTSDLVFLERKLRTDRRMIKRRTTVPDDRLGPLARFEFEKEAPGYWFQERLEARRLRPVCQVSYQRVARVAPGVHGPVRLTVDREIQAQPLTGLEFLPARGTRVVDTHVPVEMKFRVEMPSIFKELAEKHALAPLRVSKYRLSMDALSRAGLSVINA
ncbi:MAG: polyphosphate polymerase domain-containing protein, partial [Acidobacteriota bacterium]